MKLEDIKVGSILRGVKPGQAVTVLAVQWHGNDCGEITYKDEDGRADTRLCYRGEEAQLEIVERGRTWALQERLTSMSELDQTPRRRRGRPPSNGKMPGWMFFRGTIVVEAYDRTRAEGLGYDKAVQAAMQGVREVFPQMPISEAEVARIIRQWNPPGAQEVWRVRKEGNSWGIGVGERPSYGRKVSKPDRFRFSKKFVAR